MLALRARLLIVTLWAGSLWTVGYLVAPTLFATLADRALAGTIAGSLFRVQAWLSLACGIVLLILMTLRPNAAERAHRFSPTVIVLAMLACTVVGYFGLQPYMAELRQTAGGLADAASRTRFGILHGVSSGIYLLQSLLAVALVFKARYLSAATER